MLRAGKKHTQLSALRSGRFFFNQVTLRSAMFPFRVAVDISNRIHPIPTSPPTGRRTRTGVSPYLPWPTIALSYVANGNSARLDYFFFTTSPARLPTDIDARRERCRRRRATCVTPTPTNVIINRNCCSQVISTFPRPDTAKTEIIATGRRKEKRHHTQNIQRDGVSCTSNRLCFAHHRLSGNNQKQKPHQTLVLCPAPPGPRENPKSYHHKSLSPLDFLGLFVLEFPLQTLKPRPRKLTTAVVVATSTRGTRNKKGDSSRRRPHTKKGGPIHAIFLSPSSCPTRATPQEG